MGERTIGEHADDRTRRYDWQLGEPAPSHLVKCDPHERSWRDEFDVLRFGNELRNSKKFADGRWVLGLVNHPEGCFGHQLPHASAPLVRRLDGGCGLFRESS